MPTTEQPRCRQPRRAAWLAGLCAISSALLPGAPKAAEVPADLVVIGLDGQSHTLEALWSLRPLLVTLYYTRCPGVCTPYLLALADTLGALGGAGRDYDILALSFDPRDQAEQVRAHAERFGLLKRPGWIFATADAKHVAALADAFGFWYRLDASRQDYDHPTMVAALYGGQILRVLEGSPVSARSIRETLWEMQGHFVPSYALPDGETLFSCLAYDPVTGRERPNWGLLVLAVPCLATLGIVSLMFLGAGKRPSQSNTRSL
jgi:cytochrome oxidase Cu insertion factor (SCO1/SenC/PrrC family)